MFQKKKKFAKSQTSPDFKRGFQKGTRNGPNGPTKNDEINAGNPQSDNVPNFAAIANRPSLRAIRG